MNLLKNLKISLLCSFLFYGFINSFDYDSKLFVKLGTGVTFNNSASEMYQAAFGYKFNSLVRLDGQVVFRPLFDSNNCFIDNQTAFTNNNVSIMPNVYFYGEGISDYLFYACNDCFFLQPFFGFGIGASYTDIYKVIFTRHFAAQASVGLELLYKEIVSVDLGYRFFYGAQNSWNCKTIKSNELFFDLNLFFEF